MRNLSLIKARCEYVEEIAINRIQWGDKWGSEQRADIPDGWCLFPDGWVCVHSKTLWVSATNCSVRLGVSPAASAPTGVFSQRLWGFISRYWSPGLHSLSRSPIVPPSLSARKCGTTQSTSHHLAAHHLHSGCWSLPLLLVWMNVSSLTSWLSDFYTVQFSGSSGDFLFLSLSLSFFWLFEEAKCIHLCLYLGQKSKCRHFNLFNYTK